MITWHFYYFASENLQHICQKYLAVFSCQRIEDQCRGTLSHVDMLRNWFFQTLTAQMICSNMLRSPYQLTVQPRTNTSRRDRAEKAVDKINHASLAFPRCSHFFYCPAARYSGENRVYCNNCYNRPQEHKSSKNPFCLAPHRALTCTTKNATLMPCLHSISNNNEEDGGLQFLSQPRWATIQDTYKCSTAGMPDQIKLEFTLLHRN